MGIMQDVLIVDDDPANRRYLKNLLEEHGMSTREAINGMDALEKAGQRPPSLIVSDAMMPVMDGFQLLMELKAGESTSKIPFIFYTGHFIGEKDAELAKALGADEYLIKPLSPEDLFRTIAEVLARRSAAPAGRPDLPAAKEEQLRRYGEVVASKLEEKIAELEHENAERKKAQERLQSLSRSLLESMELERRHIARELHDEVGQALTAVRLNLQGLIKNCGAALQEGYARDCMAAIDMAVQQVRDISLNLRPSILDDLGFAAAIRWYLKRTAGIAGVSYQVVLSEQRLPADIETALFRIAQEAITNALRHAGPSSIYVELSSDGSRATLIIRNNGRFFDVEAAMERAASGGSFGLLSMRERAGLCGGTFVIRSSAGFGTEVRAEMRLR